LREGGRAALVLPDGSLSGDGVKARVRQNLLENCNLHTIVRLDNSVFKPYASVKTNLLFFEKGTPTKEVWYYKNPLPEGTKSYGKQKTIQLRDFDGVKTWWNNRTENEFAYKVGIEQINARNFDLDIKHPNEAVEETLEAPDIILTRMQENFETLSDLMNQLRNN
jgi:type I restriction enzyme M protein